MNRVVFFIGSRANYASIKSVILACNSHSNIDVQVVVYASAASDKFGELLKVIRSDGIFITRVVDTLIQGDSPQGMAESTGLALLKIPQLLSELNPDVVVTVGDRFETLAVAVSAAYMNKLLAHTMGGEITGSIDESVRHAITKLAHIHFPATPDAARNLKLLGEIDESIHLVGCPRIDLVDDALKISIAQLVPRLSEFGIGEDIDVSKPFLLVSQHPVTTEFEKADTYIAATLSALDEIAIPTIMLWPNSDAGHDHFNKSIRSWQKKPASYPKRLFRNLPPEMYLRLMSLTSCLVGNSSSGLREGAFIGTPVINIGSRQAGREKTKNVKNVDPLVSEIVSAVKLQIKHGPYPRSYLYGNGNAGFKIAEVLGSSLEISPQKQLKF